MPLWQAVLLGILQGLTEFLPISSTAHLLVAQELLGRTREQLRDDPFTVVIQLGTLIAVYWYFRRDIAVLARAFLRDLMAGNIFTSGSPDARVARQIIVGTVPVVITGLLLAKWLKRSFYNPTAIAIAAIVFALLLVVAEWWATRQHRNGKTGREEVELTYLDAIIIGLFQALALVPGASRSGTTITAGLLMGLRRPAAARFSFLLSLPSILAAGVKDLLDWLLVLRDDPSQRAGAGDQAAAMLVGTLAAAAVGYLSIAWLMHYLRRYSTLVFILYRLALGAAILTLIAVGLLQS